MSNISDPLAFTLPTWFSSKYCRTNADWSQKSFTDQLSRLEEWVDSETWLRGRGADIIKGSANRAAISVILDRMRLLYRDPLAGLGAREGRRVWR